MKFNFRKIASALSSTLMIGSTVALAAAASYPAPFVNSGHADVAIVTGQYATLDTAAASILSTDLNQVFVSQGGSSGTTTTTTGESFPMFTSSTELYLNNSITKAHATLTSDDLPMVLADGDFSGDVDTQYTQTINFYGSSRILFGKEPTSNDDPTVYVDLGTTAANYLYNATVTFDDAVDFTNEDSQGETLDLFGKEWTVGSDSTTSDLVLYKSSERVSLSLGGSSPTPSQQITVDGETYTVELISGSDTDATIKVTDSSGASQQRNVNEDQSRKINGVEIALTNVDESEALGSIIAEVTVGSDKITLREGSEVEVGTDEDPIDGTFVDFIGTVNATTSIVIQVFADDSDRDAILAGESFLDPAYGSFKVDFTSLSTPLDSEDDREMMEVTYSGDDTLEFEMTSHGDDTKKFAWLDNSSATRLAYGDSARENIRVAESVVANESNYIVIGNQEEGYLLKVRTINNQSDGYNSDKVTFENVFTGDSKDAHIQSDGHGTLTYGGKTYGVSYVDDRNVEGDEYVRLDYPDSTSGQMVVYPTIETGKGAKVSFYEPLTINMDDYDGLGTNVSKVLFPDGDDYASNVGVITLNSNGNNITVDGNTVGPGQSQSISVGQLGYNFTYGGAANTVTVYLLDPRGGNIATPAIVVFEEEEDDSNLYNALVVIPEGSGTDSASNGVSTVVSTAAMNGQASYTDVEDSDLSELLTIYGTLVTLDDSESDQKTATISYPDEQVQAMISVSEGEATTSMSSGAIGTITFTDDMTSSYSGKNVIVVGGTCVNTAARTLMGVSEATPLCGSAFTTQTGAASIGAGKFLIKSYTSPWSSSKIAVLVAGYEADDTKNGAMALRDKTLDVSVGKEYTGTSATEVTAMSA